jgi:DNA-binding helix-hairpin-helix protein with protein kinase domain
MTTGHSSSALGSMNPPAYTDADGQRVRLDAQLGSGGEGAVFAVESHPTLAAKIYHKAPLADDHVAKLSAMIERRSSALDVVSAWPHTLLFDARKQPCGLLLPKVSEALQLHELYGTSNRRMQFPYAKWHHLVLAARNVAAAFECMHKTGVVVGDVNQGNLLVDKDMCVRFIDCDSFQILAGDRLFPCPVGTPHFTPPELQSKKLRDEARTPQQDRFGLAVLIFHLLFVGRHPFAGRYYGSGELTIEKAIAERRFAFSKNRSETLVEPPPASLLLTDVSPGVAALFESAFRGEPQDRPTARQWVEELEGVIRQRKACSIDPAHIYFAGLHECPWCRIEDEGGPAFFVLGGSMTNIVPERLDHLEAKLRKLMLPVFPDLAPNQLRVPQAIAPKRPPKAPPISSATLATWTMAAGAAACLAAPFSGWALIAGFAALVGGTGWLVAGKDSRERRKTADELAAKLEKLQIQLYARGQGVTKHHNQRRDSFEQLIQELKMEYDHYRDAGKQLSDILGLYRVMQRSKFLASHLIQKNVRNIRGMSPSLAAALASYGIESAQDVDPLRLLGLPMMNDDRILELRAWRDSVERQFVFKPEHGISLDPKTPVNDVTVKRFKAALARRILMAARQLESVVSSGREQLALEIKDFEKHAEQVRAAAGELRESQTKRRRLERLINRNPAAIFGIAAGIAAFGALIYWMNH